MSPLFSTLNGTRQGSVHVLSPRLFCVYMDDLCLRLNRSNVGCRLNGVRFNHLMYADDLVIFSPTNSGLQTLVNICAEYGSRHDISFNPLKSNTLRVLYGDDKKDIVS